MTNQCIHKRSDAHFRPASGVIGEYFSKNTDGAATRVNGKRYALMITVFCLNWTILMFKICGFSNTVKPTIQSAKQLSYYRQSFLDASSLVLVIKIGHQDCVIYRWISFLCGEWCKMCKPITSNDFLAKRLISTTAGFVPEIMNFFFNKTAEMCMADHGSHIVKFCSYFACHNFILK